MTILKTPKRLRKFVELATWPITPSQPRVAVKPPPGLVCDFEGGHYWKSRERFLYQNKTRSFWRHNLLVWLRDHVSSEIPRLWYNLVLGHDLHVGTYAECYVRHFHYNKLDPFTGEMEFHNVRMDDGHFEFRPGWWENIGLFSRDKVCEDFRDLEVDAMQGLAVPIADYEEFAFHRVGTDSTAEDPTDSDLVADAGITTAQGTQIEGATADIYKTVSTITADASETWNEHCVRSQTGLAAGTMVDRSVQPGSFAAVSVVASDTCEFTYELTKNAEA